MDMPTWWDERRFGIAVHSSLATVPAWAPIGEYAGWYRSHLGEDLGEVGGEDVGEVGPHARPMVEVLAHHRDRWGHIERYDDFLSLLTYDRFDAESWARLVVDAGAGYTVFVAKPQDGWAWWDAPGTERTVLHGGPRRNVLAEYAAACERNGIVFGTSYSLLDWGDDRSANPDDDTDMLHPQVLDLVRRYGSNMLWGDGHRGQGSDVRRTDELLDRVRSIDPNVVIDDRWGAADGAVPAGSPPLVHTFEYHTPDAPMETPWVLYRAIGASFGHNRNERAEHHLCGREIVALLTEVVAKGGHLLLAVGPSADGTVPDLQSEPLLEAGTWIRAHQRLIDASTAWETWGDDEVRYLLLDGDVHAVDVAGRGRFAALSPDRFRVHSVDRDGVAVAFRQDDDGVHLDPTRPFGRRTSAARASDVAVYRVGMSEVDKPVELFETAPRPPIDLAPLLREASPGDIVQLGDGCYLGPVTVPAGVTLRGLGSTRTTIDAHGSTAVTLERNARLEHVRVAGLAQAAVVASGPYATVLGCRVDGHVAVRSDGSVVRATRAARLIAEGADRLTISRCQFRGTGWDVGVHLVGGSGHEIDSCEFRGHLCAIRATDTTGTIVRGNNATARWWGIHLEQTDGAHVYGNFIDHTMRGIDIDGGTQAVVDGNAVCDGDSGSIVAWGASDCQVSGNRWERCRIGVLAWEAIGLHAHDNEAIDLHEPDAAHTAGP